MSPTDLSDADIDALLDGKTSAANDGLLTLLGALDGLGAEAPAVTPSPELSSFLSPIPGVAGGNVVDMANSRRRRKVVAGAGAFAGTLAGKVLLGTAVAAAAVGGAHATDTLDVPGLPDAWQIPAFVDDGPSSDDTPNPSDFAPGQDDVSPSDSAPGQVGDSPSDSAPGQVGDSPSDTAPGQVGDSPSDTAPGQVGDSPSDTAPGQVGDSPSVTAPGQGDEPPSITAAGQDRTSTTRPAPKGKPND